MSIVIFHQLSGIDPCEKHIIIPVGHAKQHFFMVRSKLEAKAIYVVKRLVGMIYEHQCMLEECALRLP